MDPISSNSSRHEQVLDLSRPVVTVRRRSYEYMYGGPDGGGSTVIPTLPYSNSLTRPSARNSPAAAPAIMQLPATASGGVGLMGPVSPLAAHQQSGQHALSSQLPMVMGGRYDTRSRRSSMMSGRAVEDTVRGIVRGITAK